MILVLSALKMTVSVTTSGKSSSQRKSLLMHTRNQLLGAKNISQAAVIKLFFTLSNEYDMKRVSMYLYSLLNLNCYFGFNCRKSKVNVN